MVDEWHPISKQVYEAGKSRRLVPDRIRPLGYYALRALTPVGSHQHAFEELVDIFSVQQVLDELYRVDFTEFPPSGDPQSSEAYFTDDGYMVVLNDNPRLPGLPDLLEVGYVLARDEIAP